MRIPGGYIFTVEDYWLRRNGSQACRHCRTRFVKGDAVVSKNRTRNRSAQYHVSCALHLNMFSEKDVERAIRKGVIVASALA